MELDDLKEEPATLKTRLRKLSECLGEAASMVRVEQMLLLTTTTEKHSNIFQVYVSLNPGVHHGFFG